MMRVSPRKGIVEKFPVFQGLKQGFRYTFGFMPIRYMILLLALVSLMGMPFTVLMPVFAKSILHGGSHTFGFLMGASGIGALIGAIYMASRKSVLGLAKNIPLFAGIFGIGLIAFSLSHNFFLSCFILLVTGLGMIMQMTSTNTILQTIVDDDKRGRVMSFYTMAFIGTAPFGSLFAGFLASKIGAPYTVIIGGASCLLGAVIYARKLPEIRKLVRLIYTKMGIIQETGVEIHLPRNLTSSPPPE